MMIQGTATDYINLADIIYQTAQNNGVSAVAINAGGTGYTVGDILTVAGGTTTGAGAATLEVTSVSGGVIDGIKVKMAGAYSSNPTTTANAVTGGTGSSATMDLTMLGYGWTGNRRTQEAASATVAGGGTGYTVNDQITLDADDGAIAGTSAVFNVDSVSGGVITAVSLVTAGDYAEVHGTPTAVSVTGGTGGDDATLNVTFQDATTQDSEFLLEGSGASADEIYVGIQTFNDGSAYNWELAGFTGYSATDIWANQPGISPGRNDQSDVTGGAFTALASTAAQNLEYWVHIDTYAIVGVARNSTSYQSFYLGWLNPFGTASEFTYPLCVAGNTSDPAEVFNATSVHNSGISDPIGHTTTPTGPMLYRNAAGTWQTYQNGYSPSGSGRTITLDRVLFPTGGPATASPGDIAEQDLVFEDNFKFASTSGSNNIIPQSADPGSADYTLAQTPDTGGDITFLWPLTLVEWGGVNALQGELRNAFWVHNDGGIVAEDDFRIGGVDFRVFQAGSRSNNWAFWALREN